MLHCLNLFLWFPNRPSTTTALDDTYTIEEIIEQPVLTFVEDPNEVEVQIAVQQHFEEISDMLVVCRVGWLKTQELAY